jgi:hypothetical protein
MFAEELSKTLIDEHFGFRASQVAVLARKQESYG